MNIAEKTVDTLTAISNCRGMKVRRNLVSRRPLVEGSWLHHGYKATFG